MAKKTLRYTLLSFAWTWGFWALAYIQSVRLGHALATGDTLFELFGMKRGAEMFLPQALFALAVFGPLLGYLLVAPKRRGAFLGQLTPRPVLLAFIIPVATALPGIIASALVSPGEGTGLSLGSVLASGGLYLLSNLVTSGTEEFGWRGFLYPHMRQTQQPFWNIAWKSGLLWAVWHYPLMLLLYGGMGVAVALPTLAGFTAGIVAMAYLSNYVYERTHSIGLLMLMHALNNTGGFILMLLYPKTPFTFLSSLVAWALVAYLEKKHPMRAAA